MNQMPTIAYIFEKYPVLSQTFLRREIAALQKHGLRVEIHAMFRHADEMKITPLEGVNVNYFSRWEVLKLMVAFPLEFLRNPKLFVNGWRLWRRAKFTYSENYWSNLWAVIFAVVRAGSFRRHPPALFHGVRATGAATGAALLSRLCKLPYSFGGHAYDLYRHGGDAFLKEKLRNAAFVHTTTATAAAYLREQANAHSVNIILARRGLSSLPKKSDAPRAEGPLRLLSVGRLVPKKGHNLQLAAFSILHGWSIDFEARIVGEGPLRGKLRDITRKEGLQGRVKLPGAMPSEAIEQQYEWADIFLHTGVVDPTGDRDGLPNVIPEAMAHGLPVIASDLPELREAVEDNETGFLVKSEDSLDVANAIARIAEHPELGRRLGENGREWVEKHFLAEKNTRVLADAFKNASIK